MSAVTPDHPHRPGRPDVDPPARLGPAARRPERPDVGRSGPRRAPLIVAAAVATGWAALVSYLPVALVMGLARFAGEATTPVGAARVGLAAWLLGHGVPLQTSAGPLALPPLALGAFAAWRVARAGLHVSRAAGNRRGGSPPGRALGVAVTVGLWYGLLGALAASLVADDAPVADPLRAGLTLAGFGAAAALVGALRRTGVLSLLARSTPAVLRDGVRTGLVAALLVLAAGAAVAGLAVATGGGEASDMIAAYRTGVTGQAGITLVSLAYSPNAAVWAACYLLGPGFAVGVGTAVRTTEVTLGGLPAVPLLAGLPHGPVGGFGAALLLVPVLAGIGAGVLLYRRIRRSTGPGAGTEVGWGPLLGAAATAGPVAAVLLGLAALVSGGSLGAGRLARIGPVSWQVALVAALVVAVGAMIGAAAVRAFATPDRGDTRGRG
ncbi:cell division protein PerM [Micromonospora zhanjiangensis]|uniref:DUF6350 family protein n=1 Tax=Micromonospora zhanjiangensis TaxID=1522057 RepID=A0ABV8KRH3_9ACTN